MPMGMKAGLSGTLFRAILAAACMGALLGLLDASRLEVFGDGLEPHQWLVTSVWYVLVAGLLSLPLGFACHLLCAQPRRWVTRAPVIGSFVFAVAALVNVLLLPDLRHPASLGANVVLLAGAWLALRRAASHPSPALSTVVWAALLFLFIAPSALVAVLNEPTEPAPVEVVSTSEKHPSVLILLVDTLRRDHVSFHGYERETTPNLDAFARDSLAFDRARAAGPWTKPSIASIHTGLHPTVHGVEKSQARMPAEAVTIAEILQAGGYATLLVSDNGFNSYRYRHDQGFDDLVDVYGGRFVTRWRLPERTALASAWQEVMGDVLDRRWPVPTRRKIRYSAEKINDTFLDWLDEDGKSEGSWFAFLHYMEPHLPYDPPSPWDRKFAPPGAETKAWSIGPMRGHAPFDPLEKLPQEDHDAAVAAYDGGIAYWDHRFGILLDELDNRGALENTILIVVSDHGEGFWEHKTYNHCNSHHEELLRVPLVMRGPGVPAGFVPHAVSLESLHATIKDLVGLRLAAPPKYTPAPSLLPLPTSDRVLRARSNFAGIVQQARVVDRTKWILSRRAGEVRFQCFDLRADPGEQEDIAPERRDAGRRIMEEMLSREKAEYESGMRPEAAPAEESIDDALRGLGYLE